MEILERGKLAARGTLTEGGQEAGALVRPARSAPAAREALDRLRAAGIRIGIFSASSGPSGPADAVRTRSLNRYADRLLGPFGVWVGCTHGPGDRCPCRMPEPGLVLEACRRLGTTPGGAVVVGHDGASMEAARRAGARGILVPASGTSRAEIIEAPAVAGDLWSVVVLVLGRTATHAPVLRASTTSSPGLRQTFSGPGTSSGPGLRAPSLPDATNPDTAAGSAARAEI
ncbi:haloacid dehalogenase [Sinomonas sp. ASV486]|uniref:HAD hydrolase-like protein n=1 Tax=Sinomonas sp. ASV486 TaxID=3051170 RepID=UPI0027DC19EE|nr:HAD hydrolase-like protein [Sinomonas sp. ASV486]MDQ4492281.1 haloacid dehalogenase [Sinomonas sp. ASV486]